MHEWNMETSSRLAASPPSASGRCCSRWPRRTAPARGSARIAFSLPNPGRVKLSVYDLAGARVRTLLDGERSSGAQSVLWDGRDSGGTPVRAGAYFIRLEFAGRSLTQRLVMTR